MKIRLKKVHNNSKILFLFFTVIITLSGVMFITAILVFRFKPVFQEKAVCAARNKANAIINSAVTDALDGISTEDFENITYGEQNSVSSISTNTIALNRLKAKIFNNLSKYLNKSNSATIYIPIGSLTKYPALQGMGYKIPIKIIFDTGFNIDFSEALKDAGINQVYYETYIEAVTSFDIISALMVYETTVTSKIPISQTLIVGKVPEEYGFWYENARR